MNTAISVIIPAYNSSATIVEALESVAFQTFQNVEVIVVDDASTDNTVKVVKQWADTFPVAAPDKAWPYGAAEGHRLSAAATTGALQQVTVLSLPRNSGPAVARNRGIAEAHGEWIGFLDADDLWPRDRLSVQLASASAAPDVGLWCGRAVRFDAAYHKEIASNLRGSGDQALGTTTVKVWPPLVSGGDPRQTPGAVHGQVLAGATTTVTPAFHPETGAVVSSRLALDEFATHNPVATSTVLARTEVLRACGGFDEQFRGPEDYDLWMRIAAREPVAFLDVDLAWYAQRAGSLSLDDRMFLPQVLRVLAKAFAPEGVFHGRHDLWRPALANQYWNASWMAFQRGARRQALASLSRAVCLMPRVGGRQQLLLWWRYLIGRKG